MIEFDDDDDDDEITQARKSARKIIRDLSLPSNFKDRASISYSYEAHADTYHPEVISFVLEKEDLEAWALALYHDPELLEEIATRATKNQIAKHSER